MTDAGPRFDPQTGAWLGEGSDPRNPAPSSPVARNPRKRIDWERLSDRAGSFIAGVIVLLFFAGLGVFFWHQFGKHQPHQPPGPAMSVAQARQLLVSDTDHVNALYGRMVTAILSPTATPQSTAAAFRAETVVFTRYVHSLTDHQWPQVASADAAQTATDLTTLWADLKQVEQGKGGDPPTAFIQQGGVTHQQLDQLRKDLGLPPLPAL
jgi:hypothetical protein